MPEKEDTVGYAIIFITYLIVWLVSATRARSGEAGSPLKVSIP
jgi:hypothetical protein